MPQFIPQEDFFSGAGGEVDECAVTLRFFGDDLEPDKITALLGVLPTDCCRKGDSVRSDCGRWLLDCERTRDTADNQIRLLLSDLTKDLRIWEQLAEQFRADIMCNLFIHQWNRGTILSNQTLEDLAARKLKLFVDIYTPLRISDDPNGPLKFWGKPTDSGD